MTWSSPVVRDSVALSLGGLSTLLHVGKGRGISVQSLRDRRKNKFQHLEPSIKSHFSLSLGINEKLETEIYFKKGSGLLPRDLLAKRAIESVV